jgi:hypothetical protein
VYRLLFSLVALASSVTLLSGCGSSSSAPPTPLPQKTYSDAKFRFSFKYPGAWSVPRSGGHQSTAQSGVPTYIVPLKIPGNPASVEVTADGQIIQFPPFEDGHVSADPNGGPDFYHYYHRTVDGLPAMRVERWSGKQIDEVDTFVNTSKLSFDIRTDTATPPFPADVKSGYDTVVKTIKLPF